MVTIVQSKLTTAVSTGPSATLDAGATAGNLLLFIIRKAELADPTSAPSGYSVLGSGRYDASSNDKSQRIYGKVATGGETTASATYAASNSWTCSLIEIAGSDASGIVAGTTSIQATNNGSGAATSLAVTAIDPTSTGDVLMVASMALNGDAGGTPTWTNSYVNTIDPNTVSGARGWTGTLAGTNLGSTATTATWTNSRTNQAVHFVLEAAAAATTLDVKAAPAAGTSYSATVDVKAWDGTQWVTV